VGGGPTLPVMRSKLLTAPDADARQLALILVVTFVPAATWLACGAAVAACKRYLIRMVRKNDDIEEYPRDKKAVQAVISYLFHLIFEIVMISMQTAMGVARSVIQYLPLIGVLLLSILWSILMLNHSRELIRIADVFYETLRPNVIETVLQILNMARVLYAIFVGAWDAGLQLYRIPKRLMFDAGFHCGGVALLQRIAADAAQILRAMADALAAFFTTFANKNQLDVDLTHLSFSIRYFLMGFVEVIECS
jgi:hypothetical protein